MQHCGKCGHYNSTDNIFCSHCGNRLNNKCPSCGFDNLMQQKFCGNCGKQLIMETDPGHVSMKPPPSGPTATATATQTETLPEARPEIRPEAVSGLPGATRPQPIPGHAEPIALEAYALLSLEFTNWDAVQNAVFDIAGLEDYRNRLIAELQSQIIAAHGHINASKNGVLFASFKQEPSLAASMEKAVRFSLDTLQSRYRFEEHDLSLRLGLDIEQALARNPLTSTVERSVGLPGTLTLSEAAYNQVQDRFAAEPIGPVPVGNRMLRFYRILPSQAATLPTAQMSREGFPPIATAGGQTAPPPLDWGSVAPTESFLSQPPHAAESHETVRETVGPGLPPPLYETLGFEPVPPAPGDTSITYTAVQEIVREPETPSLSSQNPPAYAEEKASQPAEVEEPAAPEGGMLPSPPTPPGDYTPPALGMKKTGRQPNLDYERAIEALSSELSGFLSPGLTPQKGRVLALCGADGLGKSHIVNMARGQADPENQLGIWMGGNNYRCFHRNELPLFYWLEMVQNLLSLVAEGQSSRDVKEQVQKFLSYIYEGEPPTEDMAFLEDLLSIQPLRPLSVEDREHLGRAESFFLHFLKTLAVRRPVILVVEDLGLADAASLDLLTRLLERDILEQPIYFIFTQTRDFYAHGRLAAALQKVAYKELVLSELNDIETERFLDDGPLGGRLAEFPGQLIDMLLQHAKGQPFYLEEALRLLHLKEILTVDPHTHKFIMNREFHPADVPLPDGIKGLVRMRLNYLDEKTLYVLRLAAVLGEKFAVSVLMALSQLEDEDFNQSLTTLFNHGYLYPDAVNTGRFRHGLVWEAVYEDTDEALRVQMHQLVSEALESDFQQYMTVNPMLIAYHAENGQLPKRALNYWNLAGIYAAQLGSLTGMNMAMFRAVELLRESTQEPLHTQELALRIVENLGGFNLDSDPELSIELLEWVSYYRKLEGDLTKLLEPLGLLASAYEAKGDFSNALATLDKALELVDPKQYPLEHASLLLSKMEHLFTLGRLQQALELMDNGLEPLAAQFGEDPGFRDSYLNARLFKAQILLAQCDPTVGALLEECIQQTRNPGQEGLQIAFQLTRARLLLSNGQYEDCNREADGLLSAIERMENSEWFLAQWGLLAMMYHCDLEDWESASQLVLTVVSKAEEARDYHTWVLAQTYAGHVTAHVGQTREARKLIEQAIEQSSDFRFASAALLGWRFLADFELALGNREVAYEIAAKALDIAKKPEIRNTGESIFLDLAATRALIALGNIKAAGKILEPLWPQVIKTRRQPLIAQCAFEIGQLYKQLAQDAPADLSRKHLMRSVEFFLKAKGIWLELRHLPNVKKIDAVIPQL